MADSVATALGCFCGLAYSIMHDHLKFRKAWGWWVPRELKDPEKINWMGLSLQYLLQYADQGEDPTHNKASFNAMETSQFTFSFNEKV
jgi:hypothetical protein